MKRLILSLLVATAACTDEPAPGAAAAEDALSLEEAPPPPQIDDAQWFERKDEGGDWAGYGVPFSEAAFSVRCDPAAGLLVFNTTEMPPSGPGPTRMRLSAPGFDREIAAVAREDGLPNTSAEVRTDSELLQLLVRSSGEMAVRVGGSDPLAVPISDPLRRLVRDCAKAAAP